MGMDEMRWFEADVGVRRSKMRRWESEETEERSDGECGEKAVLYVQLCVGRVVMDCWRRGDHCSVIVSIRFAFHPCFPTLETAERELTILIVPSQLLLANVSLATKFQYTLNTSLLCSCQLCTGNCGTEISNNFTLPSPHPTTIWFSCASDHAVSKRESCVSYLFR